MKCRSCAAIVIVVFIVVCGFHPQTSRALEENPTSENSQIENYGATAELSASTTTPASTTAQASPVNGPENNPANNPENIPANNPVNTPAKEPTSSILESSTDKSTKTITDTSHEQAFIQESMPSSTTQTKQTKQTKRQQIEPQQNNPNGQKTTDPALQNSSVQQDEVTSKISVQANTPVVLPVKDTGQNMYRLYNPHSGEHFYTLNLNEAKSVATAGWRYEGVSWIAPSQNKSKTPVYRLYNPNAGDHHYTTSAAEKDYLVTVGWRYEGIGWYSADTSAQATLVTYRLYNPNAVAGAHHFTRDKKEADYLRRLGWRYEGTSWSSLDMPINSINPFWLVTSAWGTQERYWIARDAQIAKSRLITASEGAGYNAYAKADGAVVRGAYAKDNQWAWLANNDGKLASAHNGWLVTSAYSGGLERYYLKSQGNYALARIGYFTVDGKKYYGWPTKGSVYRNQVYQENGAWWQANNDGVITKITSGKIGYQNPQGFYQVSSNSVVLPSYATGYFTYVTPSRISPAATREDCVNAFLARAREYLGTPYRWNWSMQPGVGVDCIGLVYQCAYATGMNLGEFNPWDHMATGSNGWHSHDANNFWNYGAVMHVPLRDRRPGDVLSWRGHVGIYMGNDTIIEARGNNVHYSNMYAPGVPRGALRLYQ